jgi:death-on-curing protein
VKKEPEWLRPDVVVAVHELLLADFGGPRGIRDAGLLESALARPCNVFAYREATVCEPAASYAFGVIRNHPFIDGNKRTAFALATVFLELNGRRLHASEADALIRTLALAAGDLDEAGYAAWLQEHSEAV